jgi:Tfp pilus assembly pilus retraction ATPase PilT
MTLLSDKQRDAFKNNLELDLSIELKDQARFRLNIFAEKK